MPKKETRFGNGHGHGHGNARYSVTKIEHVTEYRALPLPNSIFMQLGCVVQGCKYEFQDETPMVDFGRLYYP
jgi:hypothetical protein